MVQLPGYAEPAWLAGPTIAGIGQPFEVHAPALGSAIEGAVWSPATLAADRDDLSHAEKPASYWVEGAGDDLPLSIAAGMLSGRS